MQLRYMALIFILLATPWIWNAAKFASCDFESNWKCEAIHAIGIFIPPAAYITVWFGDDED